MYTAIFGDYDELQELPEKYDGVDFICFTDNKNTVSDHWKIIYLPKHTDPSGLNRRIKILPHLYVPEYEYSLYVDGHIKIRRNPIGLFLHYQKFCTISVSRHPERRCLYSEAEECLKHSKGNAEKIRKLVGEYKFQGFPVNFGLYEMGIMFRKTNDDHVKALMDSWWEEYSKGAKRDQISFPYVMWKQNFTSLSVLEESPRYSKKYFSIIFHGNEKKLPLLKKIALQVRLHKHHYPFLRAFINFIEKSVKR